MIETTMAAAGSNGAGPLDRLGSAADGGALPSTQPLRLESDLIP